MWNSWRWTKVWLSFIYFCLSKKQIVFYVELFWNQRLQSIFRFVHTYKKRFHFSNFCVSIVLGQPNIDMLIQQCIHLKNNPLCKFFFFCFGKKCLVFIWQMYCRIHGGSNINAYNHRVGVLAHTYEYHFDQHWGEFGCEKSVFFVSFFVSFCLAQHWQDGKNCWLLIRQTIMHHRDQSTPQCCSTMFVLILIWIVKRLYDVIVCC